MPTKRRDWSLVNEKLRHETVLPRCGHAGAWIRSHIIERAHDQVVVHPDDIVPLCLECDLAYDRHELDISGMLTRAELTRAIALVGEGRAARRIRSNRHAQDLQAALAGARR